MRPFYSPSQARTNGAVTNRINPGEITMHVVIARWCAIGALAGILVGCGSSSSSADESTLDFGPVAALVDDFVADSENVDGVGLIIVHRDDGVLHEEAFGTNTIDTTPVIASVSKVAAAGILMTLDDRGDIDFDIDEPIETYLDWGDRYPGVTTEHLLSNVSGLPGLFSHGLPYEPHICMFIPDGDLIDCAQTIYDDTNLEDVVAPDTAYRYGGGQWQLAGGIAEIVSGWTWWQMVDELLAQPCDLAVFEFGNPYGIAFDTEGGHAPYDGTPESLIGQDNPNIEGGAISNIADYGKILMMHLNDGMCGDNEVMSAEAVATMRIDRSGNAGTEDNNGSGYGLGWQINLPDDDSAPTLFHVPGAFGSIAWIDLARGYGGYITMDADTVDGITLWSIIRPQIEAILDAESED